MALFLLLRRSCGRGGQTLFRDDLHRILDRNLHDAAGPINPLQLFIALGVVLYLFAQIGLRLGFLARKTKALSPGLRRPLPSMSLAPWRRTRIDRRRTGCAIAQDPNRDKCR